MRKTSRDTKWHKLDNTAKIFPIVAGEDLSNVYRISAILNEEVQPELLQQAVENILPWFETFRVRLKRGIFWYYFETNKKVPSVEPETQYPCRYIDPYSNKQFLFKVTYFENRINIEVFHVITDGMGAFNFIKELTYQYLHLAHPEVFDVCKTKRPHSDTLFGMEDSYLKYYKKMDVKGYQTTKSVQLTGPLLMAPAMGVMHGTMDINDVKKVAKSYGVTITQYLCGVVSYSIYKEYMNMQKSKLPIRLNVPVNLRQFFESETTRNFFATLITSLDLTRDDYTLAEILTIIREQLEDQLTKQHLEELISYNVANEKNVILRRIPLFIKSWGAKYVYSRSVKAFTTTVTNLGNIDVSPEYQQFIESFHVILGTSKKQAMKCCISTYKGILEFTFSSVLQDTSIQKAFFRTLVKDGIHVVIESNGVYHEAL